MPSLSLVQLQFLEHHRISLSRVFDATGMSNSYYRSAMDGLEMVVAFGVTPCKAAGHTLRSRGGHCVQCKPATLAFVLRYDDPGEVYVAHSPLIGMIKIGVANDHQVRLGTLNEQGYGGTTDWTTHFCCRSARAGRAEFLAQKNLGQYRTIRSFSRSGNTVNCQELFSCDPELAVNAVTAAVEEVG